MRAVCRNRKAVLTLVAAVLWLAPYLRAEIKVEGSAADKKAFLDCLKSLVTGATVSIQNDRVRITGTPANEFGKQLKKIVDDAAVITARVGMNQPGVFVGAFLGASGEPGVQAIDLDDLAKFAKPSQGLPTKGAMLIHELAEAFDAVKAGEPTNHLKHHKGSAKTAEDAVNAEEAGITRTSEFTPSKPDTTILPVTPLTGLKPGQMILYKKKAKYKMGTREFTIEFPVKMTILEAGKTTTQLDDPKAVPTPGSGKRAASQKEPALRLLDDRFQPLSFVPLDRPGYLTIDLLANILVSETRLDKVVVFSHALSPLVEITDPALVRPQGIAASTADDRIFVAGGGNIVVFDGSGDFRFRFSHPLLADARGVAIDRDGNLFVSSFANDSILKFDRLTGTLLEVLTSPLLDGPEGLAISQTGQFWVSSFLNDRVLRFDPVSRSFAVFTSGGLLDGPTAIALSPQSPLMPGTLPGILSDWQTSVVVASTNNNRFLEFDIGTAQLLNFVSFKTPAGIGQLSALDPICDMDRDGDVDRNDIATITAKRNTAPAPGDFSDVDGDGTITVNDARICTFQCTRPLCGQ